MKDCLSTVTANGALPPNKRMNYSLGMVMGVDDFRQEQIHFEWKNRLSNLLLHGYGTACGLAVTTEPTEDGNDVLVRISEGHAVSPRGNWIWVDQEQCAQLGAWIAANPPPIGSPPESPPASLRVYVKLCYDECLTDLVPVAGRPCATDEDTRAPSRVQEAFQAEFTWEKPEQPTEDLTRIFGTLLGRVVIAANETSPLLDDSELLLNAVRALGNRLVGSPVELSPPDFFPPEQEYVLPAATACETLRTALTIWVTEVCPRYQDERAEDCILLACIDLELGAGNTLVVESVSVDNCDRPILVPTRLQQELFCLLRQQGSGDGGVGPAGPPGPTNVTTEDPVVNFASLDPGQTVYSAPIQHRFDDLVPITLAVEMISPEVNSNDPPSNQPSSEFVNVALTVYYMQEDPTQFRIGVTNISRVPIEELLVRWWAFESQRI